MFNHFAGLPLKWSACKNRFLQADNVLAPMVVIFIGGLFSFERPTRLE